MSSSNTKSRNFRRRTDDEDSNSADASAAVPSPPTSRKPPPPKPSSAASKPKKLLSFADDEGDNDDDSAVTPLNHSSRSKSSSSRRKPPPPSSSGSSRLGRPSSAHKLTASKDRVPLSSPAATSNVFPQAGSYTKEAILELQKNTRTLARPSPKPSPSSEPKIILKGRLKPAAQSPNQTLETYHDSIQHIDDDDDGVVDANTRMASIGLEKSVSHDYPDPETIRKIRAEREKKRQSRASAADFIPLNGPSHAEAVGSSDDDDEPELRTRVAMVGKRESNTHGVFEDVDHVSMTTVSGSAASARYISDEVANEVDDEDEEDKIWEEEQFRKGLGKRMDDASATTRVVSGGVGANVTATMQQPSLQHRVSSEYPNIGGDFGASQRLDTLTIQQQADVALKALKDNSRKLQESHDRTVSTLAKTDENLSASLDNITSLEVSLSAAGEKFIFMQRLRDFVSVLCEFLQHKAPFIEELEERMQKVQEKRAAAVLERRTADNDDEMVGIDAAVKAAMLVFRERGNTAMMIAAAASAAQTASASVKEQATKPELDELGRDMSRQKNMEIKRRAEARQRRRAKFDSKRISYMEVDNSDQKIEGESSTDESESESEAYQSSRDMCLRTAGQILSDASEEYSQLQVVKERLENWKMKYAASYRDAYMSLSIPAIFSPYVRLELLQWDPLHKFADFFDMKWHSLLFDYGLPEGASDLNAEDADSNLVPQLVEKVAIPKLHHQIVHCWDTLSTLETGNAVSATSLVINYVPASSQALAELLVAIRTRLADAVADIMVPNWGSLVLKAVPSAARVAAYRFGVSIRLIRNICLWKDILALPVLEELVINELLRRKVLPHVQSISSDVHDAVARTERIVASLTGVWAGPNVTGDHSGKLQSVVDFVVSLGRTLEKKQAASGVSEGESNGLARRLKKLLVELNDYDNARGIAKAFRLREAL
ncbi:Transcriptional repressor ILP1 [Linum perenne]